ncbi:MAG: FMN-binding protein [Candidatus Paceibacteria bacterium]
MNTEPIPDQLASKKLILSLGVICISIVYAALQRFGGSPIATLPPAPATSSSVGTTPSQAYKDANTAIIQTISQITGSSSVSAPSAGTTPTPTKTTPVATTPAPAPTPAPTKPAGQYTDGSYTGSAADAYYGTVQVKAIVQNGRITDVQFLQYPNDRSNSRYINSQAMPLLTQEAIQVQSAQVDGVSGATFTSQAFQQSLASALVKAKA